MLKKTLLKIIKNPFTRTAKHLLVSLRNKVFRVVCDILPVKNDTILFESYMASSYACSPRAIYEYILNEPKYNNFRFVWVFREPNKYTFLTDNGRTSLVKYRSFKYYASLARSKYWIVNGWIPTLIRKKPSQIMVQTWHGTPLKRLRNDLIPETKHATLSYEQQVKSNKIDASRYDYFVSPSRFASQAFRSAFALEELGKKDIIIETGYPRNDFLFTYKSQDVDSVKQKLNIPGDKKIILYAPTWRDDQHDKKDGFIYNLEIDFNYLKRKLGDEYVILFRAHYNIAKEFDFKSHEGFVYDVSGVDEVNELYIISDLLITDYSSVFFDYANLKRPMIFYMYDLEHYEKQLRGFYFDVRELPGPIVKTNEELAEAIVNVEKIKKDYAKSYKVFNKKYNYLDDAHASQRVVERVIG